MKAQHLLVLVLLILFPGCKNENRSPEPGRGNPPAERIAFRKDGTLEFIRDDSILVRIDIEVADNDSTRTRGLMERTSLPQKSGMLFIFNNPEPQSFWMSNTPLSLDITFVGADSTIVEIAKYTRPISPNPVTSGLPAQFVIETVAGFTDRYGVAIGDRVNWTIHKAIS